MTLRWLHFWLSFMTNTSQEQFLRWAESKSELWLEINRGKFKVSLLDAAIQDGVAHYLRKKEITPLRQFLELAARMLSGNSGEKILTPSLAYKGMPAHQENLARVLAELCEVYGFMAEYESGWRICRESGIDCDTSNYLVFGVKSRERRFGARQAYYFPSNRPPLTEVGRKQKAEIFPVVDEALTAFERQRGINLFDFYLDIAKSIFTQCSAVPDLEHYGEPKGQDLFGRGQFQSRILEEFQRQFANGLKAFDGELSAVFKDPADYAKLKEQAFERFRTELHRPLRQKRQFLYGHFYEVCTSGKKYGLRVSSFNLEKVYQDGQHQVSLPFFPMLIRDCMARHVANLFRDCEDHFRRSLGLRGVGQGWVSEATLFAQLKKAFPQEVVLHHATPEWIGRQHLDIYFPRLNIAVEYQGLQHGKAISFFGGEAALRVRKRLDKRKRKLCKENGCLLIEAFPEDSVDSIINQIKNRSTPGQITSSSTLHSPDAFLLTSAPERRVNKSKRPLTAKTLQKRKRSDSWKKHLGKENLPACARHGERTLIQRLANERAALKTFRNAEKETLLFVACIEGNIETATALLDLGLDPNARDRRKASILSKMCNRWQVRPRAEVVRLLLERDANPKLHGTLTPSIFDRCGYALPMNGCCIDGFLDCAQVLFEWTKSVNQRNCSGLKRWFV